MNILVYDVAASSRGALSILTDFHKQVIEYGQSHEWFFIISTPELEETKNVHVLRYPWIKKNPLSRVFFDQFVIQRVIKEVKADVILSLQNVCVSKCNVPQYISLHNALSFHKCDKTVLSGSMQILKQKYLNQKVLNSLRKAEKIFVPNEWIYDSCITIGNVDPQRISIIKPVLDLPKVSDKNDGLNQEKISFFYPANAEPYKRHDLLMKAGEILKGKGYKNYQMVFTAAGSENPYILLLKSKAEKESLPVCFHGAMSRENVYKWYQKSILVFTSEIETDALPIIEAMMCNAFIIATETDFAKCILKQYPNCVLVPMGDEARLAEAMEKALRHEYVLENDSLNSDGPTGEEDGLVRAVIER